MIKTQSHILVESVFSDDGRCRFSYTKTWEAAKPKALFILMNPSKGTALKLDNTIVNITNYCVGGGYGSFRIVNLFPYMATDPKELIGNYEAGFEENMQTISESLSSCDRIFIAWGTEKKYVRRKREIERLFVESELASEKIWCWYDAEEYPKHLRILPDRWDLKPYVPKFFKED